MIDYEEGVIPSRPLTLMVRDEFDTPVDTLGYDSWHIEMRGTDDEDVDLSGVQIVQIPDLLGAFSVIWPKTHSIFDKKGKYVLRLILSRDNGAKDITRSAEIRVREFGRLN